MVLGEPRGGAVVEHEPVLAQHQPVARFADRQRREGVGIDAVEEDAGVFPLHVDLAEGRDIAHPGLTAHRRHFAVHRILGLLAPFRVVKRAKPGPGLDEHRPLLHGVSVRRRKPGGAEVGAAVMAGKSADGDRREGRPEGRGADRTDIAPGDGSEHRRAIDIADLALIGRHAERGIALEMLRDAKALAHGKLHV